MARVRPLHPLADEEWIFGTARSPFVLVPDEGDAMRPELFIWMTADSPLGISAHGDLARGDAIVASLRAVLSRPDTGTPRTPTRVRAANPADARTIGAALGAHTEVTVAPTPEILALLAQLSPALLARQPAQDDYAHLAHTQPELAREAFGALARLYRRAPWHRMHRRVQRYLVVDAPAHGIHGACVRLFGSARFRGYLLYDSVERCREDVLRALLFDEREDDAAGWHVPSTLVGYLRGADVPESLRRQARQSCWEVADADAYPQFVRIDDDGQSRALRSAEFVQLYACLGALERFVEAYSPALRSPRPTEHRLRTRLPGLEGAVTITGPSAPWLPGDSTERWSLAYDAHPIRRRARHFLAAHGPFAGERFDVEALLFNLLEFAERDATRQLGLWTPAMLDAYLFEHVSPWYLGHAERLRAPDVVRAVAAWLRERGEIDRAQHDALVAHLRARDADYREREARRMRRATWLSRLGPLVEPLPTAPCPCGSRRPYRDCCEWR